MSYTQAKTQAQHLANLRGLDHYILFDGKYYHVVIAQKHTGGFMELVHPEKYTRRGRVKKG